MPPTTTEDPINASRLRVARTLLKLAAKAEDAATVTRYARMALEELERIAGAG